MIIKTKMGYAFLYKEGETISVQKGMQKKSFVSVPISDLKNNDVVLLKKHEYEPNCDTISEESAKELGRIFSTQVKILESEKKPTYSFICRVENENDLNELSDVLGQKLTPNTGNIYYPLKDKVLPSLRYSQNKARIKVKSRTVQIVFNQKFLSDLNLDFTQGVRIWFDSESKTIKIGMNSESELKAKSSALHQYIYIGEVLRFFKFKVKSSMYELPIEVNDDLTLSVCLKPQKNDDIPESIIKGSRQITAAFLKSMFERDFDNDEFTFMCTSPTLLHQVRFLLFKMNILTTLDKKPHTDEATFWDMRHAKTVKTNGDRGEFFTDTCDQIIDASFTHSIDVFDRLYHSFLIIVQNFDFHEYDRMNKNKFCVKKRSYDWTQEWFEMPEFIHSKIDPFAEVNIRFDDECMFEVLSKKLKQRITQKTRSVWFPERHKQGYGHLRWKSES